MPYITKRAVAVAGHHAADWLKLWYIQLDTFLRYCETLSEITAAWRSDVQETNAPTVGEEDARIAVRPRRADLAVEDLLGCWSRMYQAAVFYDAVNAMQPHAAQLIKDRIEEFHDGLAVAQTHGEPE